MTITAGVTDTTEPFDITIIQFNESITGLDETDLYVSNGTVSEFEQAPGNPRVYTARITPTNTGLVTIEIPVGATHDIAGNPVAQPSIQVNAVIEGPVPEITTDAEPPVNEPFTITITFSVPATGFDIDDLMVENGTASEFEGSGEPTPLSSSRTAMAP